MIKAFINKYSDIFIVAGLFVILYLIFFYNIGNYYLMDVDETRYVAMARDMFHSKDFLTLYLNGEYFFEKPPLYFWNECISFFIFNGKINEFSARFPVALMGFLFSFIVYFTSRLWIDRKFGIISSLIMATSLQYIILSKYAILDIVLTFYICVAIACYIATYFCKQNHLKIYWWLFYIFIGLGVMTKGLPALVVPWGGAFLCSVFTNKLKEFFNFKYFGIGILLILVIIVPWHYIMLKLHGKIFFDEYVIKHHVQRFFTSYEIGRKQPFYYYFLILLWGFIPWIFSCVAVLIERIKNLALDNFFVKYKNFTDLDNLHKLIFLALIFIFWILLFFSISSTKLPTYTLSIYYPLSLVMGAIWCDYTSGIKWEKTINYSVIFAGIISIIIFISAILSKFLLPANIYTFSANLRLFCIIIFAIFGILSFILVNKRKYIDIFILYICFMTIFSMFGTKKIFEIDYKFGQQELVEFAKFAKDKGYTISANGMSRKYSLLYYGDSIIDYNKPKQDIKIINDDLSRKKNYVILEKRSYDKIKKYLHCKIIKNGNRYIMIKGI